MKNNIIRRKLIGTFLVGGLVQACGGGGGTNSSTTGGGEPEILPVPPLPNGPTLSNMSGQMLYVAHRGSAALYPEETALAYDKSVDNNQVLLECDVQSLADGVLGLTHDTTIDRVTTSTGPIARLTESQWRGLKVDGDVWHGSNYGVLSPLLFADWVSRYKEKAILVPEDKDLKSMSAMLDILSANNVGKDQALLQSFTLESLRPAIAAGYQTCFLAAKFGSPGDVKLAGVQYAGVRLDAPTAEVQKWVESGLKILIFTVNRRYLRDMYVPLGVRGFFSDDPSYLAAKTPLWSKDRFELQTWVPGMLGSNDDEGLTDRGKFLGNDYWGYEQTDPRYRGCLQGYLCPIKGEAEPKNYSFSLNVRFDRALNNDSTRWAAAFIGVTDRPYSDSKDGAIGYHILFRKSGSIAICRKTAGALAQPLTETVGTSIADGEEASYRITVTEGSLSVARLRADGGEAYSAITADVSSRGSYLQLGRNGLACGFRRLAIS